MRVATIDLGTNTFNLLIIEKKNDRINILYNNKIAVKLGSGGLLKKRIADDAFERGISAMKKHKETIDSFHCEKVKGFATSMVRDAENGKKFVQEIYSETGIEVEVIDGDREAELIWKGVRQAVPLSGKYLIMDIGGGSTEFIIADNEKIYWKKSYQLGVTRLFEHFLHSDPIRRDEILNIEKHLANELHELFAETKKHEVHTLIGSAGSFETFLSMSHWKEHNHAPQPDIIHEELSLPHFHLLKSEIISSTHNERVKMKGLIELRRDLIVISVILVDYVIRNTAISSLHLSTYALKEGALSEILSE